MEKLFFEFIHNLIAHPLLSVAILLRMPVITLLIIITIIVSVIRWKNPLDGLIPSWSNHIDPIQYADKFHDWTASNM